ncbi:MAG TPA: hypothetical protein VEQ63_09170 [Bryobacteraceae bacterium]|nr:hypothetical protein [Bryobacteraceae bacterium]
MHRIAAIVLLLVFSVSLIPVASLAAANETSLPACCRKDGKHGCGMPGMKAVKQPVGVGLKRALKYPLFPAGASTPAPLKIYVVRPASAPLGLVVMGIAEPEQAEARFRILFGHARQKRGPPSFPS